MGVPELSIHRVSPRVRKRQNKDVMSRKGREELKTTYDRKTDLAFRGGLGGKKIPGRDAGGIPGLPCWRRRLRRVVSGDVQEGKKEKQEYHTRLGLRHCQVTFFSEGSAVYQQVAADGGGDVGARHCKSKTSVWGDLVFLSLPDWRVCEADSALGSRGGEVESVLIGIDWLELCLLEGVKDKDKVF